MYSVFFLLFRTLLRSRITVDKNIIIIWKKSEIKKPLHQIFYDEKKKKKAWKLNQQQYILT